MNDDIKTKKWQEDKALARYKIIAPLTDEELDIAKRNELRLKIAENIGISVRTLYRWEKSFVRDGFAGLKPMNREQRRASKLPGNFDELIEEAIQLKREVPRRSVSQIIYILEGEGLVPPGILKRSTVQRYLYKAGFGKKQMKKYAEGKYSSSKRFCKPHRMMLVQGDIKYGLMLPIGKNGKKIMTYLSALIDDHSRLILSSDWYDNQEGKIVEDTFHKCILRYGKPDAFYLDNGSQYISKELRDALGRLSIRVLHAKPYAAQSKGKIERFNEDVDSFLEEAKAKKIRTLEDLNRFWHMWVDEYYHYKEHEGIKEYYVSQGWDYPEEGISPMTEWKRDSRRLCFLDTAVVAEAFLHHAERLVDKGGCISLYGKRYEVSAALIGAKVEVSYDPMSLDTITVRYPGMEPVTAHPLTIKEYCDPKPAIPASMLPTEPQTSRLLDVLEKKHESRQQLQANAISFSSFRKDPKDGDDDV
jgi:transposase